ncbi:hypothetical protein [Nocardioides sp.]|uniref:hypothetical protein n=1 Tax=Nocardioides sp. TaxID=35761 RepID=UPI003568F75F
MTRGTSRPGPAPRRRVSLAALSAAFGLVVTILALPAPVAADENSWPGFASEQTAVSARKGGVDTSIGAFECRLLGRAFVSDRGCARTRCIRGAVPFKESHDAEMCTLRGQVMHGYGAPVDFRRCKALGRRWIHQVNWCASNPQRTRAIIWSAPQCKAKNFTYVTIRQSDGGLYDQCLKPSRVRKLKAIAKRRDTTVGYEAARRSRLQCSYLPRHRFRNGLCVKTSKKQGPMGGTVMIGDSITWRGTDELARLRKDITIDGFPGRNFRKLMPRLNWFRADHGQPTGFILALGTNGVQTKVGRKSLARAMDTLPASTTVMLVAPYRASRANPPVRAGFTRKYEKWMRKLAADRPNTCFADWPKLVTKHPRILGDGVHPTHQFEGAWAKWISRQWDRCQQS